MTQTHLEIVQDILAALDSETVNSWDDTVESEQVGRIVKRAYEDFVTYREIPEQKDFFSLTASGESTEPVKMSLPSDVRSIEWIKYDKQESGDTEENWTDITWLSPKEFLDKVYRLSTDDDDVDSMTLTIDSESYTFNYRTDQGPNYWTSFDDDIILFDAYDSEVDTTLQKSKTVCYGLKKESYTLSDGFTPNLDPVAFRIFFNEALDLASTELKQTGHGLARRNAKRGLAMYNKHRAKKQTSDFNRLPDFGRKR